MKNITDENTKVAFNRILKRQTDKIPGFTLIEILVVCLIIAILATLVIVNLDIAAKKSRDAQRKSDLTRIASALDGYKLEKKIYLSTGDISGSVCTKNNFNFISASTSTCLSDLLSGGYLTIMPKDPIGNEYKVKSNGNSYKIIIKSDTIKNSDTLAKDKAGEFYDGTDLANHSAVCLQASSDNNGYNFGIPSDYCDNP